MYYKNVSLSVKTFHGVTFKPGETKEVDKYINHKLMVLISEEEGKRISKAKTKISTEETSPQLVKQQKPSSEKPKKTESEAVIQPANDDIKSED